MFIYFLRERERDTETEQEWERGRERGRHRIQSRLPRLRVVSTEPDAGLKFMDFTIIT